MVNFAVRNELSSLYETLWLFITKFESVVSWPPRMWKQTLSKFYLFIYLFIITIKALIRMIFFVFFRKKNLRYGALKENYVKERLDNDDNNKLLFFVVQNFWLARFSNVFW